MKPFVSSILLASWMLLTGCAGSPLMVMPPLQYKEAIDLHIPNDLYLNWQTGSIQGSVPPLYVSQDSGILGAILVSAIHNDERRRHPGRYTYVYGKAQEAVFMTSLKNIFLENKVFKSVSLVTAPPSLDRNHLLMTVRFKRARVAGADENFKIILNVELTIQAKNKAVFKRVYLLESDPGGAFSAKTFIEQQSEVSQQLLKKIIMNLNEWKASIH